MSKYDFCGWATKNDIPCEDGLVITKNAFMHQDGETVPFKMPRGEVLEIGFWLFPKMRRRSFSFFKVSF